MLPPLATLGPAMAEERRDEPEPASSLDYLQSVYRDAGLPIGTRMRAAGMALPFEHPKLAVLATLRPSEGLGDRLERAIARSLQSGITVIDAVATEVPHNPPVRLPVEPTKKPGLKRCI
jgi:hypothetical protein